MQSELSAKKHSVYFFENRTDNVVQVQELLSFDELVEMFIEPLIADDKDQMMFTCCYYKSCIDDYRPAMQGIYENGEKIGEREKIGQDGMPLIGRYADNVIQYTCLMLDYDGGFTIPEAIERFIDYVHFGYTSFNHSPEVNKFRVLIPLKTPIKPDQLKERKKAICKWLGDVDESCLAIGRAFYVPSCSEQNKGLADRWYNDQGKILDWEMFEAEKHEPVYVKPKTNVSKQGKGKIRPDTMDIVSFMKDRGLYSRPSGQGKHDVICPAWHEHTNGDKTGTVVFEATATEWPRFYCSHTHDFGSSEFWEYFKLLEGKHCFDPYCERETLPSSLKF